jgi:hypothetical protein
MTMSCRPRRDQPLCLHGWPEGFVRRHAADDPDVGRLLCPDCYDYPTAVLWNAYAPELWRRFTQVLPKRIAAQLGIRRKAFRESRTRLRGPPPRKSGTVQLRPAVCSPVRRGAARQRTVLPGGVRSSGAAPGQGTSLDPRGRCRSSS